MCSETGWVVLGGVIEWSVGASRQEPQGRGKSGGVGASLGGVSRPNTHRRCPRSQKPDKAQTCVSRVVCSAGAHSIPPRFASRIPTCWTSFPIRYRSTAGGEWGYVGGLVAECPLLLAGVLNSRKGGARDGLGPGARSVG